MRIVVRYANNGRWYSYVITDTSRDPARGHWLLAAVLREATMALTEWRAVVARAKRCTSVGAACTSGINISSSGMNIKGAGPFSSSGTTNIGFITPYKEIDDI